MMIAKFSTAEDLMAHYATVRARLHGAPPKVVIHPAALPPLPEPEPEPPQAIAPVFVPPPIVVQPHEIRINFEDVVALICSHLGYQRRELFANRRFHKLCFDRQLMWALAHRHCLHMSLPQIGRASGGKDHTTVLHGRKRGLTHPDYELLSRALTNLFEEKHRANGTLIEQAAQAEMCHEPVHDLEIV
jgi:hypothetical protein